MPFSRFERLAKGKRELLLDQAAREFATYGFEQSSLNRILEQANMSKGAAYYYFEDKADLFCTVIQYVNAYLCLADLDMDTNSLAADNFWQLAAKQRREPILRSFERPWLFKVFGVITQISPAMIDREPLASLVQQRKNRVMSLIVRGQELGVIRTDLPNDLLFEWLLALDQASDTWLMSHWGDMDKAAVAQVSDQTIAAIRSAFDPASSLSRKVLEGGNRNE